MVEQNGGRGRRTHKHVERGKGRSSPPNREEMIFACDAAVKSFLQSGASELRMRPTLWDPFSGDYTFDVTTMMRGVASKFGCAWVKGENGDFWLVKHNSADWEAGDECLAQLVDLIGTGCAEARDGTLSSQALLRSLPLALRAYAELRLGDRLHQSDELKSALHGKGVKTHKNGFSLKGVDSKTFTLTDLDGGLVRAARQALYEANWGSPSARAQPAPRSQRTSFLGQAPSIVTAESLARETVSRVYRAMLEGRARLPAFQMRDRICDTVRANQVTIILGATGCGKTTQVPQFLLEDSVGSPCRVVATQPRRLSTFAVAERVAAERGVALGETVGYKVRFEDTVDLSGTSRIVFCTVGVVLKTLQSNAFLPGATHVIVDEVHERDLLTDFFLVLVRRLLKTRPEMKLVLMSATVDPTAFTDYFPQAALVEIPGKTNYPIKEYFLEDFWPKLPEQDRGRLMRSWAARRPSESALQVPTDAFDVRRELKGDATAAAVAMFHAARDDAVDVDLVGRVVLHVHRSQKDAGAILVFLPGWTEISKVLQALSPHSDLDVHALHSRLPQQQQRAIFEKPPPGKRKVIVSTVLAETSITFDDVVHVVDSGKGRFKYINAQSLVSGLRTTWYSKANGLQRRGRAGRVQPGAWWRVYSHMQWRAMDDYATPEMLRSPLEELCLDVAALRLGHAQDFLSEAPSPPDPRTVDRAVSTLTALGALSEDRCSLTLLGGKLSALKVHPVLGKLLLLGDLFGCQKQVLTLAALLGYKSPFVFPMDKQAEANEARLRLAEGSDSDHALLVKIFETYAGLNDREKRAYAQVNFLSRETLDYVTRLRDDLSDQARALTDGPASFVAAPISGVPAEVPLTTVLLAALFPNVAHITKRGRGTTIGGLEVAVHPGSLNCRAEDSFVVYFDIQETTARFLYDTSSVTLAQLACFVPELRAPRESSRKGRVVLESPKFKLLVDAKMVDDLLRLRAEVKRFVDGALGEPATADGRAATAALCRLFADAAVKAKAKSAEEDPIDHAYAQDGYDDYVDADDQKSIERALKRMRSSSASRGSMRNLTGKYS